MKKRYEQLPVTQSDSAKQAKIRAVTSAETKTGSPKQWSTEHFGHAASTVSVRGGKEFPNSTARAKSLMLLAHTLRSLDYDKTN